ncbi:MAG: hypothetical protein V4543_15770 [Bacteroidota bacterium]
MPKLKFRFLMLPLLLFSACGGDTRNLIPQVVVYEEVFLNSYEGLKLINPPNWIYHAGGIKGLIVHSPSTGSYVAFERCCPWNADKQNAVMVDVSGLFLVDTACGSRFDWSGNVLKGPAYMPLLQYKVDNTSAANRLVITNTP